MKKILVFLQIALGLCACQKEELPLPAFDIPSNGMIDTVGGEALIEKGVVFRNAVSMESDYKHQLWFDLSTNKVVSSNLRTDWDLAFDCAANENKLYLNAALNASVAITSESDFSKVSSDAGLIYKHEHHSGQADKLAIGDVTNQRNVLIIDRGYSPSGKALGKWKIQISLIQDNQYYFSCSKLNGELLTTAIIAKKPQFNKVAFSFTTLKELQIEPPKTDYDICFTQYTHLFENPPLPYSVNGVVLNSFQTLAAEEFSVSFDKIDRTYAEGLLYSDDLDVIGYDWKSFDLNNNSFTVYSTYNYLIKDASGNIFKLRFLDFYDENGVKGMPSFELVRL